MVGAFSNGFGSSFDVGWPTTFACKPAGYRAINRGLAQSIGVKSLFMFDEIGANARDLLASPGNGMAMQVNSFAYATADGEGLIVHNNGTANGAAYQYDYVTNNGNGLAVISRFRVTAAPLSMNFAGGFCGSTVGNGGFGVGCSNNNPPYFGVAIANNLNNVFPAATLCQVNKFYTVAAQADLSTGGHTTGWAWIDGLPAIVGQGASVSGTATNLNEISIFAEHHSTGFNQPLKGDIEWIAFLAVPQTPMPDAFFYNLYASNFPYNLFFKTKPWLEKIGRPNLIQAYAISSSAIGVGSTNSAKSQFFARSGSLALAMAGRSAESRQASSAESRSSRSAGYLARSNQSGCSASDANIKSSNSSNSLVTATSNCISRGSSAELARSSVASKSESVSGAKPMASGSSSISATSSPVSCGGYSDFRAFSAVISKCQSITNSISGYISFSGIVTAISGMSSSGSMASAVVSASSRLSVACSSLASALSSVIGLVCNQYANRNKLQNYIPHEKIVRSVAFNKLINSIPSIRIPIGEDMSTTIQDFPVRFFGESRFFSLDFGDDLSTGDTISSASWQISVESGNDPYVGLRLVNFSVINNPIVSQQIDFKTNPCTETVYYLLTCVANTSLGETVIGASHVTVVPVS